jgi:hypothetical protein
MATRMRGEKKITGLLCFSAVLALLAGCGRATNICRDIRGTGTWQFLSPQGDSGPTLTTYPDSPCTGPVFTTKG